MTKLISTLSGKIFLLAATIFAFVVVLGSMIHSANAQTFSEIESLDAFATIIKEEIQLSNDLVDYIDSFNDFENLDRFINKIKLSRNQFQNILSRLEGANTGHPIYQKSIDGVEQILKGLNSVIDGIQSVDEEAITNGLMIANEGIQAINDTIHEYDTLVANYNSSPRGNDRKDYDSYASNRRDGIFDLKIFFIFLGLAIGGHVIMQAWGNSVNKDFERSILKFLSSGDKESLVNKHALDQFGKLAMLFLPFLVYLLAFSLYSVVLFVYWGFGIVFAFFPMGALVGFGGLIIGTGIGLIISVIHLINPPRREALGIEVKKENNQELWKFLDNTAQKLKAAPIDKILVAPNPGVGVYLEGGLFKTVSGGGSRVLEIGLPSIYDLKINEFEAIIAHEYGHFSNKDTQWGAFIYAMGSSLTSALQNIPGPSRKKDENLGVAGIIFALNPAYWTLRIFTTLFFMVTSGFSRAKEVRADLTAMDMLGGEAFRSGLLKVATNDAIFSEIIQKQIFEYLEGGHVINNFSKMMEFINRTISKNQVGELQKFILEQEAGGFYDSHPQLKIRLDYASKFGMSTKIGSRRSVDALFDDWEDINVQAAKLYNERLIALAQRFTSNQTERDKSENEGGE